MIQVTQEQADKVAELKAKAHIKGGVRINTIIIYELWPLLFGIRKKPNGCNSCLRNDMRTFLTQWDKLAAAQEIEILGSEEPEAEDL